MVNEKQPEEQSQPSQEPEMNWHEQIEFLRGLAHIVKDERLSELSVESGGVRLQLKGAVPGLMLVAAPMASPAIGAEGVQKESGAVPVVSPMVGVFYRSPSPADPPFVEVGDSVTAGQVIGVVEAMKVFNELVSDVEGIVVEIVAQNSELVETGQTLILVKKS